MEEKTILVVDDEERNIKLIKAMLGLESYRLSEAMNGEEALSLVEQEKPDLILLDVMMPGLDGFEVCKRLKDDDSTKMIPVCMVTALREKEHLVKAMKNGADDFLSKPVDQTELLVRVKSLLRIKSYQDELTENYREIYEKNQKLEELERIKEGLTHMIIHDLRNPLAAISGNLELLLMRREGFTEKNLTAIDRCLINCSDLKEMIGSLLDIHRMEEGALELNKETVDLSALIEEVLEQFTSKAASRQISLSFQPDQPSVSAEIDPGLIKRVVANLMNNALRHTPPEGSIEISMPLISPDSNFRINVMDSGNGLNPEYHQIIFDKFEQADRGQNGVKIGGSGLGLTFCKMAVEAHGGKIWVESEGEGNGSTFSFTLPGQPA